ncbi:MAG: GtrA family protein [Firmicutes bacterium]|nr:GtrA family protein [Bacillota bacterium]
MPEKGFLAWLENNKFAHRHPELWKYVKFFLVGLVTSLPDWGSYMVSLYALRALGVDHIGPVLGFMERVVDPAEGFTLATVIYAYMISTAIGYFCAYILNRKATFQANNNAALSGALYALMVVFTIFANSLAVGPFISGLVGRVGLPAALSESISKLLVMSIPGIWTYPLSRFVIYRKKKEEPADEQ